MKNTIDITGLDKAEVLEALYNASKPQGLGLLHFDPSPLGKLKAQAVIQAKQSKGFPLYFDYLLGRVMKVDLSDNELNPILYDRDNGKGAAESAIAPLIERRNAKSK